MASITTRIVVLPNGTVSLAEPLPVGEYLARVEIIGQQPGRAPLTMDDFPQLELGPFPEGRSFSREEIYSDDGR